jgi:hypothetical protein
MKTQQMVEFISLWSMLDQVVLSGQQDTIRWKWMADGCYSSRSAYQAQFIETYCSFDSKSIWSAKVEDKHRFFAWLLIQCKLLTVDRLTTRSCPCNPVCQLCEQELETMEHIGLWCVFAQEVWFLVSQWTNDVVRVPARELTMAHWWNQSLRGLPKKLKQHLASLMIYTTWNIWKERNRRIFDGVTASPFRVLNLIKEELKLRRLACGG